MKLGSELFRGLDTFGVGHTGADWDLLTSARLGHCGWLLDLEFYTDFSTPFNKKLPLKVGKTYELGFNGFELHGLSPGLGELTLTERPGTESGCRFDNIQKDAAGENLYGTATFRFYGFAEIKPKF